MSEHPRADQAAADRWAVPGAPPEQTIRLGNLRIAVWLNTAGETGKQRTYRTVSVSRSYQQDGQWTEQRISLVPSEIPALAALLDETTRRLFDLQPNAGVDGPI